MNDLDARTHAFNVQTRLADVALQGQLDGNNWSWVTPSPVVSVGRISFWAQPHAGAAQVTEALPGETLEVLWQEGEWLWARTVHDRYLGWVEAQAVVERDAWKPDLTVQALRGHAYAGPKVSRTIVAELCLGARVKQAGEAVLDGEHRRWVPVALPDGGDAWVQEVCFQPLNEDVTALARRFLEVPYVWGGRSAWGLDCSGLTQLVYAAVGKHLPRDADQQQQAVLPVQEPQAGDLAFFPGHVGLMLDGRRMIHANATGMRVTIETLGEGEYGGRLAAALSGFGRVP